MRPKNYDRKWMTNLVATRGGILDNFLSLKSKVLAEPSLKSLRVKIELKNDFLRLRG